MAKQSAAARAAKRKEAEERLVGLTARERAYRRVICRHCVPSNIAETVCSQLGSRPNRRCRHRAPAPLQHGFPE